MARSTRFYSPTGFFRVHFGASLEYRTANPEAAIRGLAGDLGATGPITVYTETRQGKEGVCLWQGDLDTAVYRFGITLSTSNEGPGAPPEPFEATPVRENQDTEETNWTPEEPAYPEPSEEGDGWLPGLDQAWRAA